MEEKLDDFFKKWEPILPSAIAEFYLLQLLIEDTPFPNRKAFLQTRLERVTEDLTDFYKKYILLVSLAEARHMWDRSDFDQLGLPLSSQTELALLSVRSASRSCSYPELWDFCKVLWTAGKDAVLPVLVELEDIFGDLNWAESFGGRAWERIVSVLAIFLDGLIPSKIAFVDTANALEHNNRTFLDKLYRYLGTYENHYRESPYVVFRHILESARDALSTKDFVSQIIGKEKIDSNILWPSLWKEVNKTFMRYEVLPEEEVEYV